MLLGPPPRRHPRHHDDPAPEGRRAIATQTNDVPPGYTLNLNSTQFRPYLTYTLVMNAQRRNAAIYLRISLDHDGDGLAIDRQREDC